MQFLDTRVRVQHPCVFCAFSADFPEVEVTQWCTGLVEGPESLAHILQPEIFPHAPHPKAAQRWVA